MAQKNKNLEKLFTFLTFKELRLCVLCGSVAMNFSG